LAEHHVRRTTLDSYDLDEVEVPIGKDKAMVKATRITIHGENIFMRALEPTVRVGELEVLYPEIQLDERSIVGYLTTIPPEGARIQLEYHGEEPIPAADTFTIKKLKRT
jgi:hypothetical protein